MNRVSSAVTKLFTLACAVIIMAIAIIPVDLSLAAPNPSYVAPSGGVFNNPYGSSSEQWKIMNRVKDAINNAPAGSVIRIAAYSITLPQMTDALIAAKNRGVNVRVVTDDHLYDKEDPDYVAKNRSDRAAKVGFENRHLPIKLYKDLPLWLHVQQPIRQYACKTIYVLDNR